MGRPAETEHPKVEAVEGSIGTVLLRSVEGETLPPVLVGGGKPSQTEQSAPQCPVGSEEIQRILDMLGQDEEFLTQLPHGL
jgi:hypothetical protein